MDSISVQRGAKEHEGYSTDMAMTISKHGQASQSICNIVTAA